MQHVDTKFGRFFGWHLKALKDGYETARKTNAEEFDWQGQSVLTGFARHLIDFLEESGLQPCEQPAIVEEPEPSVTGRPIDELHAIVADRLKSITGAIVDPNYGFIILSIKGEVVATIEWPELANDIQQAGQATRQ